MSLVVNESAERGIDGASPDVSRGSERRHSDEDGGSDAGVALSNSRSGYAQTVLAVVFGVAGAFLLALRFAATPLPSPTPALAVTTAVVLVVLGATAYGVQRLREASRDALFGGTRRLVRYALLAAFVAGAAVVFDSLAAATVDRIAVGVSLAVGVVVAVAVAGPYPSRERRQYELAIRGYRSVLDGRRAYLDALSTDAEFEEVLDADRGLRLDLRDARSALDEARDRLRIADEALKEGLYESCAFHYQAAKRELLTVEYAVHEFASHVDADSTPRTVADGGNDRASDRRGRRLGNGYLRVRFDEGFSLALSRRGTSATPATPATPAAKPNRYLATMAERVVDWADETMPEARATHLKKLLYEKNAVRGDISPVDLKIATARVHDHQSNTTQRESAVRRLMRAGTAFGLVGLAGLFALVSTDQLGTVFVSFGDASPALSFAVVALFGFLGAVTSSLFNLRDVSAGAAANLELTNPFFNQEILAMRLVVGATAGLVATVLLGSNLPEAVLNPALLAGGPAPAAVAAVAFVAGFTERFVLYSVERFVAGDDSRE